MTDFDPETDEQEIVQPEINEPFLVATNSGPAVAVNNGYGIEVTDKTLNDPALILNDHAMRTLGAIAVAESNGSNSLTRSALWLFPHNLKMN